MQTFLPYPSYRKSASVLDDRRLNKQIVECEQIIKALENPDYGWQHHPAVNMWRGKYANLVKYGVAMYDEWQRRFDDGERGGKRDHKSGERITRRYRDLAPFADSLKPPSWLGNEALHRSHRSCLLAKDEQYYRRFWPELKAAHKVDGHWPYVWPKVNNGNQSDFSNTTIIITSCGCKQR